MSGYTAIAVIKSKVNDFRTRFTIPPAANPMVVRSRLRARCSACWATTISTSSIRSAARRSFSRPRRPTPPGPSTVRQTARRSSEAHTGGSRAGDAGRRGRHHRAALRCGAGRAVIDTGRPTGRWCDGAAGRRGQPVGSDRPLGRPDGRPQPGSERFGPAGRQRLHPAAGGGRVRGSFGRPGLDGLGPGRLARLRGRQERRRLGRQPMDRLARRGRPAERESDRRRGAVARRERGGLPTGRVRGQPGNIADGAVALSPDEDGGRRRRACGTGRRRGRGGTSRVRRHCRERGHCRCWPVR